MPLLPRFLDDLRRRLRRGIFWRGAGWSAVALVGCVTLAALVDTATRIESDVLRLVLLLLSLATSLTLAVQLVVRPLSGKWDDVTMALLVERLRPQLRDRLASAAEFLQPFDGAKSTAVVQSLRTRAVENADAAIAAGKGYLPRDRRGRLLPLAAAALLLLGLGVWATLAPAQMLLAFERQLLPYSAPDWPRTTVLQLLNDRLEPLPEGIQRCLADEPLTLYVANQRGGLPRDLRLEQSQAHGPATPVEFTLTSLRGPSGREQQYAVATISPAPGSLRVRARGGDDDAQPWHEFESQPAPRLERFAIHLEPPAYAGLPSTDEERSAGHVEGLEGTKVLLVATANVPLAEVVLHRDGAVSVPLTPSEDGMRVQSEFTMDVEGRSSYWFDLADEFGLRAARPPKYELRIRRDQPPQVQWLKPIGSITATPQARLPLAVACADDFGLGTVQLFQAVAGRDGTSRQQPLSPEIDSALAGPILSARFGLRWDLAPWQLQPGDRVEFQVTAFDRREPDPQQTTSPQQSLLVVTSEEKREEINGYQFGMAQLLARVETQHAAAGQAWRSLATQWSVAGSLRASDRESLLDLEARQRRLFVDLTDQRSGLAAQIQRIRDELDWNQLTDAAATSRLDRLTAHFEGLVGRQLPEFAARLAAMQQSLRWSNASENVDAAIEAIEVDGARFSAELAAGQDAEAAVATTLAVMLEELVEWRRQTDVSGALDELLAAQAEIRDTTRELGTRGQNRPTAELPPQTRADLASIADRQANLALTLDRLQRDVVAPPANGAPLPQELVGGHLSGRMTQAAEFLAANQIGQALTEQQQILDSLATALEQAAATAVDDPDQQAETLAHAREQVDELRRRQLDLQRQLQSLRPLSAEVADQEQLQILQQEQDALAQQLDTLARQLQRRLFIRPADIAQRAAARSRDAQAAVASQHSERAASAQQEALDDLTQLSEELAAESQRVEQRQLAHLLLTLTEALPSLHAAQLQLKADVETLERLRTQQGRLSRGDLKQLQTTTASQLELERELRGLIGRAARLEVVRSVLTSASDEMHRAAELMDARQTDLATTALQQSAAERVQLLLTTLQPPSTTSTDVPPGAPANHPVPESAVDGLELRLLRELQADLLRRTEGLPPWPTDRNPTESESSAWEQLGAEQSDLADRARELLNRLHRTAAPADAAP